MAEDIYRNLVLSVDKSAPISVHLTDFPTADEGRIDPKLEENMDEVIGIVTLGRACRNAAAIKNRQPIAKMYIKAEKTPDASFLPVIAEELNVKSVEVTDNVRAFTTYTFKPQLRTVGPKYGKHLGAIRAYLAALDGNAAMDELERDGHLAFTDGDEEIVLTRDDLLVEMSESGHFESLSDKGVTVVLDKNLTPELIEEGNVREIISKVQTMRKDSGFEVTDRIRLSFAGSEKLLGVAERNREEIAEETLAVSVTKGDTYAFTKEWNVNGESLIVSVETVK